MAVTGEHGARVVVSHDPAAWLPDGGRADVVLAGVPGVVPSPICLVRLLVTRGNHLLVEARPDGRGLDIPTRTVPDGEWGEAVEALLRRTVGADAVADADADAQPTLLGYVRNTVPVAPDDYPWPSPYAHFAVWHRSWPTHRDAPGRWLAARDAEAELGDRHWWPLAAHASLRAGQATPASTMCHPESSRSR